MRCLSVKQPYAAWIAAGEKTIEIRSWRIQPGPLLIASSRKPDPDWELDSWERVFGKILCLVDVSECRPLTLADRGAAVAPDLEEVEGLYAVVLSNVRPVVAVPVVGRLGLFDIEEFTLAPSVAAAPPE
jgi:hypothetical protein